MTAAHEGFNVYERHVGRQRAEPILETTTKRTSPPVKIPRAAWILTA